MSRFLEMFGCDYDQLIEMFGCDIARVFRPDDASRIFLFVGWKIDGPIGYCGGEQVEYGFREKIVASGSTEIELIESAREYHRLLAAEAQS